MKAIELLIGIISSAVLLMPIVAHAQESQNLKLLYGDWELSAQKSTDSLLVFHSKESMSKYPLGESFSFKECEDAVISRVPYYTCLSFTYLGAKRDREYLGVKEWLILEPLQRIERKFYDEKN